jgi:hypothetical protein
VKIYLISTTANDRPGAFSRAVVAAETEEAGRRTHPDGASVVPDKKDYLSAWVSFSEVRAEYLGDGKSGTKPGVILASSISG